MPNILDEESKQTNRKKTTTKTMKQKTNKLQKMNQKDETENKQDK